MCASVCNKVWIVVLLSFAFHACGSKEEAMRLPHSKGLPSELLVITDKTVSQSDLMDSVNAMTGESVPEIMQPEPMFKVVRVSEQNYTQRFMTMHTKLLVHLDGKLIKPMMGVSRDVYAVPQTEVTVAAPDLDGLRQFLSRYKQDIVDVLLDAQLQMRVAGLRRHHNDYVYKVAVEHMGYSICVPKEVRAVKKGQRFLWAGSNLQERDMNAVLYEYPWDGSGLENMERFVCMRDSVMKVNIPGDKPGQWMCTSRIDGIPVILNRKRRIDGRDYEVVRGMWDVRNAPIGGPFVSMLTIDTVRRVVLAAEGFVYSPSTGKRDLVRQMEASLLTIKKQR